MPTLYITKALNSKKQATLVCSITPPSQYYFEIATGNCYSYDQKCQTLHLVQSLQNQINTHPIKLKLKVLHSDIIDVNHVFEFKHTMHIGRELYKNDLRLKDLKVSRHHCVIYCENEWYVKDVGSTHGTFVNNKKIQISKLADQDLLQIGSSKFLVLRGDSINEERIYNCSKELNVSGNAPEFSFQKKAKSPQKDWNSIKYIQNKERLKKKFNIDYIPKLNRQNIANITQARYKPNNVSASMDVPIKNNIGFKLLKKMGWSEGVGLGAGNQGIINPVKAAKNKGKRLGLGAGN